MNRCVGPGVVEALLDPDDVAAWTATVAPSAQATALATTIDLKKLSAGGRVDLLIGLDRQIAWLHARQQRLLGLMSMQDDAAGRVDAAGRQWVQEEVSCALRIPPTTAGHRLAEAA